MKLLLKRILPGWVSVLYNRIVSRRLIRRKLGDWFDVEWNRTAKRRSDREWLRTYDVSWENWQGSDLSQDDVGRLREAIGNCPSLLDAGCGDGFLLEQLSDLSPDLNGVDISVVGLKRARSRHVDRTQLVAAFLEALPFQDDRFDTVVTTHTLEHVKDLPQAVAELIRITARRLIVLVPCQAEVLYSEDYHLHYFPDEASLRAHFPLKNVEVIRYTIPHGQCAYVGDVLLLTASTGP